jgi:hypothetical protein
MLAKDVVVKVICLTLIHNVSPDEIYFSWFKNAPEMSGVTLDDFRENWTKTVEKIKETLGYVEPEPDSDLDSATVKMEDNEVTNNEKN